MPAKPSWLLRIPNILDQLELLDTPVIDRAICERLFEVKRRRAIDMMRFFGGYRSGNTVLVDRLAFMSRLAEIARTNDYALESIRKQRLSANLNTSHVNRKAATIMLPVTSDVVNRTLDDLPGGVILAPGKLIVEFSCPTELFAKLYELAQVAMNDFDRLCDALA
jgi:hypothetical protein